MDFITFERRRRAVYAYVQGAASKPSLRNVLRGITVLEQQHATVEEEESARHVASLLAANSGVHAYLLEPLQQAAKDEIEDDRKEEEEQSVAESAHMHGTRHSKRQQQAAPPPPASPSSALSAPLGGNVHNNKRLRITAPMDSVTTSAQISSAGTASSSSSSSSASSDSKRPPTALPAKKRLVGETMDQVTVPVSIPEDACLVARRYLGAVAIAAVSFDRASNALFVALATPSLRRYYSDIWVRERDLFCRIIGRVRGVRASIVTVSSTTSEQVLLDFLQIASAPLFDDSLRLSNQASDTDVITLDWKQQATIDSVETETIVDHWRALRSSVVAAANAEQAVARFTQLGYRHARQLRLRFCRQLTALLAQLNVSRRWLVRLLTATDDTSFKSAASAAPKGSSRVRQFLSAVSVENFADASSMPTSNSVYKWLNEYEFLEAFPEWKLALCGGDGDQAAFLWSPPFRSVRDGMGRIARADTDDALRAWRVACLCVFRHFLRWHALPHPAFSFSTDDCSSSSEQMEANDVAWLNRANAVTIRDPSQPRFDQLYRSVSTTGGLQSEFPQLRGQPVLCIGMMYASGNTADNCARSSDRGTTSSWVRDRVRLEALRLAVGCSPFSLSRDGDPSKAERVSSTTASSRHVQASVGVRAVRDLQRLCQNAGIDSFAAICVDYIRMPASYSAPFARGVLCELLPEMARCHLLRKGASIYVPSHRAWLELAQSNCDYTVCAVETDENPLYHASRFVSDAIAPYNNDQWLQQVAQQGDVPDARFPFTQLRFI